MYKVIPDAIIALFRLQNLQQKVVNAQEYIDGFSCLRKQLHSPYLSLIIFVSVGYKDSLSSPEGTSVATHLNTELCSFN